jgi:CheY-like chemotaxis protein
MKSLKNLDPELFILVVDDDKDFMEAIKHTLCSKGLINVHCCQDSRNVMPMLEKKKYSLILLDLKMSPISGLELLPQIVGKYPGIPIIVLSALTEVETVVNCMKYGAFDYLIKPFELSRLLKAIRDSMDFINLEGEYNIFREFDFSNEKDASEYSKVLLKIDYLLITGKAQLFITKAAPIIENKQINKGNVNLFYALGLAYEKIEEFCKAEGFYRKIKDLDPQYPGIQQKLEEVWNKIKRYITLGNIERYRKIHEVGRGAMGIVYRAEDLHLERMVALKILKHEAITDYSDEKRFISEGRKVAQLQHPNIVTVYDVGHMKNDCFISMEFIEGLNLSDFIKKNHPIAIEKILVIARKLFVALENSHQKLVIHRDIKPSNIMITNKNEFKVVDFGIAALRDQLRREDRYVILGTPAYMSPEQIENATIDHRTDIYSAGATLFHLVTGVIPFNGSSKWETMEKHLSEPVPSIKEYRNDVPEKLMQIIEKCMEKNAGDRYQSAVQVIEEINGISDNSGEAFITGNYMLNTFDDTDVTHFSLVENIQTQKICNKPGGAATSPYEIVELSEREP